jgi:hypothetical protein
MTSLLTATPLPNQNLISSPIGQSLSFFIGLLTVYNIYCPLFDILIKPLRALEHQHHRKPIPSTLWTLSIVGLWDKLKLSITSCSCLARYDSSLPCFFKTYLAGIGMGWILMQPDNSEASQIAVALLHSDRVYTFDLTMNRAHLRPVCFCSRSCTEREHHYHSFVGEAGWAGTGWAISQNRKLLWGSEFFLWLCDCSAIKEILEYDTTIHQIRHWA